MYLSWAFSFPAFKAFAFVYITGPFIGVLLQECGLLVLNDCHVARKGLRQTYIGDFYLFIYLFIFFFPKYCEFYIGSKEGLIPY